jgi:tetratricopeptide (TPR) repeat protein
VLEQIDGQWSITIMRCTPIIAFVLAVVFCGSESLGISADVRSATTPVSEGMVGLYRSPNPIDLSGNRIVTGNVGGGKHFRGIVPYNSVSEFGAPAAGQLIYDPFNRRWIDDLALEQYRGGLTPYYSPTKSVTLSRVGGRGVSYRPPTALVSSRMQERYVLTPVRVPKQPARPVYELSDIKLQVRPMSQTTEDMEFLLKAKAEEKEPAKEVAPKLPKKKEEEKTIESEREKALRKDVFEQMKAEFDEFMKSLEVEEEEEEVKKEEEAVEDEGEAEKEEEEQPYEKSVVTEKAKRIFEKHKTFANFTSDKFNEYMRLAEEYLRSGKYYRAADSYTMATIFKPDNPLADAGKSLALFAAGEYMSSSLYLSRAIENFEGYAYFNVDLVWMMGGRDIIDERIADIEEVFLVTEPGELHFLLSYMYYQLGRYDRALYSISKAEEILGARKSISVLKVAIMKAKEMS